MEYWKGRKGVGASVIDDITEPSLPKGSKTIGRYSTGKGDSIIRQNNSADVLANSGYRVDMLEEIAEGNGYGVKVTSNPDFLIEGNVFDCYSPKTTTSTKNIINTVRKKTVDQSERIVLNLDGFSEEAVSEIIAAAIDKTNGDLKYLDELLLVKDGDVSHIFRR